MTVPGPLALDTNATGGMDYTLASPLPTVTIAAENANENALHWLAQAPAASEANSNGVSPTIPYWRLIDCTQRHSSPTAVCRSLPEEASEPFHRRAGVPRVGSNS